jgi:mono/diheme cytochrome c family protein
MQRTIRSTVGAIIVVSVCAADVAAQAAPASPTGSAGSTLAGVYSTKQAERGEAVYKASCLECHVPSDYTGDAFTAKFVGGTAYDMFEGIRSSMPQNNPGSLSNQQYTDLVAYLFKLNGLPVRETDMSTEKDSLKAIKVEAKPPALRSVPTRTTMQRMTYGATIYHGSSHIR